MGIYTRAPGATEQQKNRLIKLLQERPQLAGKSVQFSFGEDGKLDRLEIPDLTDAQMNALIAELRMNFPALF